MIRQMKRVIDLAPKHAHALNYLGYTYAEMGVKLKETEELIRRSLAVMPGDGYITDSMGWVYFKMDRLDDALREIEKAHRIEPKDPTITEHLGDVLKALGRKKEALSTYRKALELKGDNAERVRRKIKEIEKTIKEGSS